MYAHPVSGGQVARTILAAGPDAETVARKLIAELASPDLTLAFVFADWRLDAGVIAKRLHEALAPALVVGATATGVIAPGATTGECEPYCAGALGLYGDWLRAGLGVAPELTKSALTRSRKAVMESVAALGLDVDQLDPMRNVAITLVDSGSGQEEAFCVGSAAAAPRARFVGGAASVELRASERGVPAVWAAGELLTDAGLVVMLDSNLPMETVRSVHLAPTQLKTVVTAGSGRVIEELDGMPAVPRLRQLLGPDAMLANPGRPVDLAFARYIDGVPYARSMTFIDDDRIHTASSVDVGHVLHLMRPGDLIGTTKRDLAAAVERIGGRASALLAFSCISRHWEAELHGMESELAACYAAYPSVGFQSAGEQSGMLLVNHTLTGLAIGGPP